MLNLLDKSNRVPMEQLASFLLTQALIPPGNEPGSIEPQYGIESFEIDVDHISIVNHGVAHRLRVVRER